MSAQRELDLALNAWFDAEAASAAPPEPLARILEATSHLRPRPALVAGFGSHAIGGPPYGGRAEAPRLRRLLILALVVLLAVTLIGVAMFAGSRVHVPQPVPLPDGVLDELVSAPGLLRPMARPVLAPLPDGRLLVMGAGSDGEDQTPSAELYDPTTRTSMSVGPMLPTPWVRSATPLKDGRVLTIGGYGITQIFDPDTLRFSPVSGMVMPRPNTVTALLGDGRVLIVGFGELPLDAELFDPDTLTFSRSGTIAATPNESGSATLADGRVFMLAGVQTSPDQWVIEAEVYDPTTQTFTAAGRTPDFGVAGAIPMHDGRVLVVGGIGMSGENHGRAVVWDPATRAFTSLADPFGSVSKATLLDDGRILVLGFVQFPRDRSKCQVGTHDACSWAGIYNPETGATTLVTPPAAWQPSVLRLTDGRVLVIGGLVSGEIGAAPAGDLAPAVPTVQIYR